MKDRSQKIASQMASSIDRMRFLLFEIGVHIEEEQLKQLIKPNIWLTSSERLLQYQVLRAAYKYQWQKQLSHEPLFWPALLDSPAHTKWLFLKQWQSQPLPPICSSCTMTQEALRQCMQSDCNFRARPKLLLCAVKHELLHTSADYLKHITQNLPVTMGRFYQRLSELNITQGYHPLLIHPKQWHCFGRTVSSLIKEKAFILLPDGPYAFAVDEGKRFMPTENPALEVAFSGGNTNETTFAHLDHSTRFSMHLDQSMHIQQPELLDGLIEQIKNKNNYGLSVQN